MPIFSEASQQKRRVPVWALILTLILLSVGSVFTVAWFHPIEVDWKESGVWLGRLSLNDAWFESMHRFAHPQNGSLEIPIPFTRPATSYFLCWH